MSTQSSVNRHWKCGARVCSCPSSIGGPCHRPLLRPEGAMTNLALMSSRQAALLPGPWAHDIRNILAAIGLHLDSLARLSGSHGAKAANAAHGLIARAGGMCREAVVAAGAADGRRRCHPFDIAATIRQVIDLMAPIGPEGFSI